MGLLPTNQDEVQGLPLVGPSPDFEGKTSVQTSGVEKGIGDNLKLCIPYSPEKSSKSAITSQLSPD